MTKRQGITLVAEQQAAAALLADGFLQVKCPGCDGAGHFTLGTGDQWKKYACEGCDGEGWIWKSPPPDATKGAPTPLTIS